MGSPVPSPAASFHEVHPRPSLLSDFILGSEDGIVNVLGIILGLTAALVGSSGSGTEHVRLIIVATVAAMAAESIAMGMVAYTSTRSRRRLYLAEEQRELREMEVVPEMERAEVKEVLVRWGYTGEELDRMLDGICRNPKAMLEFMMAFELNLAPVAENAPRRSAGIVGGATVLGHMIPLVPFLFVGTDLLFGATLSVLASAIALYGIGWYEARLTLGVWWRNGLQMAAIGLSGGFAGFLIGHLLGTAPGL